MSIIFFLNFITLLPLSELIIQSHGYSSFNLVTRFLLFITRKKFSDELLFLLKDDNGGGFDYRWVRDSKVYKNPKSMNSNMSEGNNVPSGQLEPVVLDKVANAGVRFGYLIRICEERRPSYEVEPEFTDPVDQMVYLIKFKMENTGVKAMLHDVKSVKFHLEVVWNRLVHYSMKVLRTMIIPFILIIAFPLILNILPEQLNPFHWLLEDMLNQLTQK